MDQKKNNRMKQAVASALALGLGLGAAQQASAELIISNLDETINDGTGIGLDLFDAELGTVGQDGVDDYFIFAGKAASDIRGGQQSGGGTDGKAKSVFGVIDINKNSKGGFRFLNQYQLGDVVGPKQALGKQNLKPDFSGFFHEKGNGFWAQAGDTGYIGLIIGFDVGRDTDDVPLFNYGWIEVTRGSLELGAFGFETTAGVGAVIRGANNVPEPTGLALLAAGAAGLAFRRKRQRATASV